MRILTVTLRGVAAALAAGALALAGCGNGTAALPPAASGGGTAAPTGLLAQVRQSGQLTVALAPFAPLEFQSATTKQWEGFDIDVLSAFARSLGVRLVVDDMAFAATIQAVHDGRADITANIFKTPAREQELAFSEPVLDYLDGVIVNAQKPAVTADTVAGLSGKSIATCRGCAEEAFVPKIPGATDDSYSTADETFSAVSTGRADAAFQPVMYEQYAVHENPSLHLKVLGPIPEAVAGAAQRPQGFYGVAPGSASQQFLSTLNTFLTQECRSGATAGFLAKYGLTSASYLQGLC